MDMNLPYSPFEGVLGAPEDAKGNAPMLRVIDPNGTGTLFWLYAIYNTRVIEFKIDGTGIYPATDRVQITYPKGLEEGRLEVFDAQSAQVRSVPLAGTPAFKEVDVANLRPGLYLVRLVLDGMQLGETKFTVAR